MPKSGLNSYPIVAIYAQASSKEQEKEGFSIPAQLKLLRGYAADHRITVIEEFVDVETAKRTGRPGFTAMVEFFKKHGKARSSENIRRILLVEKTDRLYRNLKDWVTLDDLDRKIHFIEENVVLARDSCFDRMTAEWRAEQDPHLCIFEEHQAADQTCWKKGFGCSNSAAAPINRSRSGNHVRTGRMQISRLCFSQPFKK